MYQIQDFFSVKDRAILVVGGSSGIGLELAKALGDFGAKVAVLGSNPDKCAAAEKTLKERNPQAIAVCANVTDASAMTQAFATVATTFGKLDGMVYSAGINHIEGLDTMDLADFNRVMDVNLNGFVLSSKLAGDYMLEQGSGSIVCISSYSAFRGKPLYTAYCASKSAMGGFIRALSVEWIRKGVRVNCIAPGLIVTDINRKEIEANPDSFQKRVAGIPRGQAGDVADLVGPTVMLLSDAGAHIIGQTISCDGGTTAGDMFVMESNKADVLGGKK